MTPLRLLLDTHALIWWLADNPRSRALAPRDAIRPAKSVISSARPARGRSRPNTGSASSPSSAGSSKTSARAGAGKISRTSRSHVCHGELAGSLAGAHSMRSLRPHADCAGLSRRAYPRLQRAPVRRLRRRPPLVSHSPITCAAISRRCGRRRCSNRYRPCHVPSAMLAADDRDRQVHARQRRADMGGHVVRALVVVGVEARGLGREALERGLHVDEHVGRGVLGDQQRGRGVAAKQRHEALSPRPRGSASPRPRR